MYEKRRKGLVAAVSTRAMPALQFCKNMLTTPATQCWPRNGNVVKMVLCREKLAMLNPLHFQINLSGNCWPPTP